MYYTYKYTDVNMSYLWQEFNIKTFPAETLVFRDGIFCDDLSDYKNIKFEKNTILIEKTSKLPIHIIYIGEIAGNIDLNINISGPDNKIIMTNKIFNKKPAFFKIFVKNAGKNTVFDGQITVKNQNSLKIIVIGQNNNENTGVFVKTRVAAYKNTDTVLEGCAKIEKNIKNCDSDISFSVMADENAKIILKPTQYINSVPKSAKHSASLYKPNDNQIHYLKTSGLSDYEIQEILEEAFLN